MRKAETVFRTKVRERLKTIPNAWFESIQQKAISGTPDMLGCVNGFFVALELKATDRDQPTALQAVKLQRIVDANGMALVVHPGNVDHVFDLIRNLSEGE